MGCLVLRAAMVAGVVLAAVPARADAPPWAVGVSDQQKADAKVLLDAGNALFLEHHYLEALAKYRAAVEKWDHPAIRFNIVRCLIQLDKLDEASDNLALALKYGQAPLEEQVYAEALAYQKLLANQIGEVTVDCSQPDVQLTLDGKPLATCPAHETRRVTPGPHEIVGRKPKFMARTVELVVLGGKKQNVAVSLDPITAGARVVHRWPSYVPWVVFGGGFALAGVGVLFDVSAASDRSAYDLYVSRQCALHTCSSADLAPVSDLPSHAKIKSALGATTIVAGGAAIVGGIVLLYLNRARTVYPDEGVVPAVTPTPGGAAVSLTGAF